MINCPKCGTANRDGSKFCNECGQPLAIPGEILCPMCGAANADANLFCAQCGARLRSAAGPRWGEAIKTPASPENPPLEVELEEPKDKAAAEAGLPDWLEQLREKALASDEGKLTPEEAEPAGAPALLPDESGEAPPNWLGSSQLPAEPTTELAEELPAPPSGKTDAELPEWLIRLRQSLERDKSQERPPAEELIGGESVDAIGPSLSEETASSAPAESFELPPWLKEEEPKSAVSPVIGEEREPAAPPGALLGVDWGPSLATEVDKEETVTPPTSAMEMPDWLRELTRASDIAPGALAAIPEEPTMPELTEEALPGWLLAETSTQPAAEKETPAPLPEEGGLARADIPDWLIALRPEALGGAPTSIQAGEETVGAGGILAGLGDLIPIELPVVKPPTTGELGGLLSVLPEESPTAQSFAAAAQAKAPARIMVPGPYRGVSSLVRIIFSLLLLAVIIAPMLAGGLLPDATTRPISPELDAVRVLIEDRSPGETVLVAFDFDPSYVGEMEPLAEAIVAHLMKKRVRIVALSLLPNGPALAQRILDRTAQNYEPFQYGEHYINLGYLPGQEAALRAFLTNPFGPGRMDYRSGQPAAGTEALKGLTSLDDLSLIVVLGATAKDVQGWIEQIGSQIQGPIVAGVSAAVEPYIQPYYASDPPQLRGVVAGLAGANDYAAITNGGLDLSRDMEALSWAVAFALLVIAAALIVSPFVSRGRER